MASSDMQDVKRRIKSVTSMEHITNAMKLVSAAKLRKAKATFDATGQYFHYVTDSIEEIFKNPDGVPEQFLEGNREEKKTCYIVVTGSRGLCGAFNTNVIKKVEQEMAAKGGESVIVAVGSKGRDYFAKRDYDIRKEFVGAAEEMQFSEIRDLTRPIISMYNAGKIDAVQLVYTAFINQMQSEVRAVKLLPFAKRNPDANDKACDVEYEPSIKEVFEYLVPKYLEIMLYGAIIESATCEHAARRMAMENATDNARAMLDDLSLFYNRARQAAITNEIIEIVSGAEALK